MRGKQKRDLFIKHQLKIIFRYDMVFKITVFYILILIFENIKIINFKLFKIFVNI